MVNGIYTLIKIEQTQLEVSHLEKSFASFKENTIREIGGGLQTLTKYAFN